MTDAELPSSNPIDRVEHYRRKAGECRKIAKGAASVFTRLDLGQLADLYENLAAQMETRWGHAGSRLNNTGPRY